MFEIKRLSLKEALVGLNAMLEEAKKSPGRPLSLGVSDERGDIICFYRMDGSTDFQREMVFRECYTAAQVGDNTRAFKEAIESEGMNLAHFNHPYASTCPGAVVIVPPGKERSKVDQVCTERGQIGVCAASGRWSHEDEAIAQAGATAIQKLIWQNPEP